jgi:DNA repair exonuclease SbcCD ATPase subunit
MSKTVNIEVENIGGLSGKHKFSLQEGLNVVKSSNAVGKTSFLKAIELLGLQNEDLRGRGHYANYFSDGPVSVKTTGSIICDRKFRMVGNEDLVEAGGEPLIETGKEHISSICFVTPENQLINKMLEGDSIKTYIERFSDSDYYDDATDVLSEINQDIRSKLSMYREVIAKSEETQDSIKVLNEDKNKTEDRLKKMPKINVNELFKDYNKFQKTQEKKEGITDDLSDAKVNLEDTILKIGDIGTRIKYLETELESTKKKYPKIEGRLKEIVDEIPDVTTQMEKITRQKTIADDKLKMVRENWTNRLKFKTEEGVCYACGKPLSEQELKSWENKINNELEDLNEAHKITSRKLQDLKDERNSLERNQEYLAETEADLREKQRSLAINESEKTKLERKVERLKEEESKIQKEIEALSKSADAFKQYQERDNLETQLHEKEKAIKTAEARLKELQKNVIDIDELQNKIDFLEKADQYIRTRREEIVDAIRTRFNGTINDIYKQMGFKDSENIMITPDYTVTVTKKVKGKEVEDFPLDALAASERVTLGIALLMAAKQEYLPNFPFFVIDEVVTSYDPTRFNKIKNYIKDVTDYVMVTQLSDKDGIVIDHEK